MAPMNRELALAKLKALGAGAALARTRETERSVKPAAKRRRAKRARR